jgi:hypothetical protein
VTEEEWLGEYSPQKLVEFLGDHQERKMRLLACAAVRRYFQLDWVEEPNQLDVKVIRVAEAFADGLATKDDLAFRRAMTDPGWLVRWLVESSARRAVSGVLPYKFSYPGWEGEQLFSLALIRDIFGNPFRPVMFDPNWRTSTVATLARQMYESRDFSPMPVLADALQDAGCDHPDILAHCRGAGPHARGCWVVDGVLGKA